MAFQETNIATPPAFDYETVAASQTAQVLGTTGAIGDRLERVVISVATSATGTVTILDGSTSIVLTAANTPIGVYVVPLGLLSTTGPWKITTGAGATAIGIGRFTA